MLRRTFLSLLPTTCAALSPERGFRHRIFDSYFLQILEGFVLNARRTSDSYAVCDFPDGTKIASCLTPSGKTYVSVARMLPALAEWRAGGRDARVKLHGVEADLDGILLGIFRDAFDPLHPHYWGSAPANRATQRSVEASLVAYSLWRLGDSFIGRLSTRDRSNIQNWLASCTQVAERTNNHAWFSAVNQAARMQLGTKWKEFHGDEAWMLADLQALHSLYPGGGEGWYSDSPDFPAYDYYNFWTFGNFPLYWSKMIGTRYPEWNERFGSGVRRFLQKTPYFFSGDGAHVLMGRSLIYRWALLAPLLAGYEQGLWPHSPGLLRRIVRLNLEYSWRVGCYDESKGKLRETLSPDGTVEVRESYIDNGHPYWCMFGFAMLGLPEKDRFWTAAEELLPVERSDFTVPFKEPRMLLVGTRRSGQVRWLFARNVPRREYFRDKYSKFAYSSHFPFNVLQQEGKCPCDQALVFRDASTRISVGRKQAKEGKLISDGIVTVWETELGGCRIEVTSRIRLVGEFEERTHWISSVDYPPDRPFEIIEGSYPLGLSSREGYEIRQGNGWIVAQAARGPLVASWNLNGFPEIRVDEPRDEKAGSSINLIHARVAVNTLSGPLVPGGPPVGTLHYASPRPLPLSTVLKQGEKLVREWRAANVTRSG